MAKINAITESVRQAIFDKSAGNLPYDPVSAGLTPEDIKKTLYAPITDGENSVLAELDRVIREANIALGQAGSGGSSGGGSGCDCISPLLRINTSTNYWEVSYDNGYSWTSLDVNATGQDGRDGVDGADGVTPQLRINASTSYWEVSYDNGSSFTSLGVKATGEGSASSSSGSGAGNVVIKQFDEGGSFDITTDVNIVQCVFRESVDPCASVYEPGIVTIGMGRDLNPYYLSVACDDIISSDLYSVSINPYTQQLYIASYDYVMATVHIDDESKQISVILNKMYEGYN